MKGERFKIHSILKEGWPRVFCADGVVRHYHYHSVCDAKDASQPPLLVKGGDFARLIVLLLLLRATSFAQTDSRFEELATLAQQKMAEYHVPGVALGVMKDGQMTTRGFGVTNLDDPQPITQETLFSLASISKTVTATAIMRLVEQGKIDLNAPVRRYIPDFRVRDESASRAVTILNLLTHTPGWEGQLNVPDHGIDTLASFVAGMRNLPQLAPPGSVWSYNNAGFTVAGRVIEVVTGDSYQNAVRDLVFQPAHLASATTSLGEVATHRFSVGHRQRGGVTEVVRPFILSANPPAGGVAMNVIDLLAYAKYHLDDPRLEPMRKPQLRKNATDDDMGIGWQLRTIDGVQLAMHGGTATGGSCLLLELIPERHAVFAILTNHTQGWRLIQDVERRALNIYEGLVLAPSQAIGHRGVNEAMTHTTPLAVQPSPGDYVGTYTHSPLGPIVVRSEGGKFLVGANTIVFYAPDRAYQFDGSTPGVGVEFVRDAFGKVQWIRVNGRIARKT
jgi:CubicO group peptidase (beta-lactamase class C family)